MLLNPDYDMLSKYLRDDIIVVRVLYSKSPITRSCHKIKLEKLVVDVLVNDENLDTRGVEDIVLGIYNTYDIDLDRTLAYASRRRIKEKLLDMWERNNDR